MDQFLKLASELRSRLEAAASLEDLAAIKAAFDAEFQAAYKGKTQAARRERELADANAKIAELQKVIDGDV